MSYRPAWSDFGSLASGNAPATDDRNSAFDEYACP
ncbi:MAG: hypothetical protein QOF15_2900 [Mycobacterium sp.]|nr:hypothetical protein [Mycobacterium sp.]